MSDWPSHYDQFFGKLKDVRRRGQGKWMACCPAHDDAKPSLSIAIGGQGKLILSCVSAKCETEAILKSMGLAWKDLFPPSDNNTVKPKRKEIAWYPYYDENNNLICETVRYDPKDFRQRRPNPEYKPHFGHHESNQKWIWNLDGCRKIIYRLPSILAALKIDPEVRVHVVEGEKDAESIWALGLAATTCPMGASKWTAEHSEQLRGMNVLIVPDEDFRDAKTRKFTGLEHARLVRESLTGVAKTAKIIRLPCEPGHKQDSTSFIESFPPSLDKDYRRNRWLEWVESRLKRNVLQEVADRVEYDRLRQEQILWTVMRDMERLRLSVAGEVRRDVAIDLAAGLISLAELLD